MDRQKINKITVFGEVLFDVFDGIGRLGGAPFNVAYHLHSFGLPVLFVTAVGRDALGDSVLRFMETSGMDISGVGTVDSLPTGRVEVELRGRSHTFTIHDDQAYDLIEKIRVPEGSLLYHGSLALRHSPNQNALANMKQDAESVFCDINLIDVWRSQNLIDKILNGVRWLKINDEELGYLSGLYGLKGDHEKRCGALTERFGIETVILTKGENGAEIHGHGLHCSREIVPVGRFADTVGAGDAMASVCLLGIVNGWTPEAILDRGAEFASEICGCKGALPDDTSVYKKLLKRWRE